MALALDCADSDIPWLRDRLRETLGTLAEFERDEPIHLFVRSFISGLTRDEVTDVAFLRLRERYDWPSLAKADWHEVERVIACVTHAKKKAQHIGPALAAISAEHPDFSLDFLGDWSVERAIYWLERLPGVGRKIAAATLNFSSLRRPVFVVDQHVLRIIQRFGLIGVRSSNVKAYDAIMQVAGAWSDFDLLELHALMKHLGQTVCRPAAPRCFECPLDPRCAKKKAALPPPFHGTSH